MHSDRSSTSSLLSREQLPRQIAQSSPSDRQRTVRSWTRVHRKDDDGSVVASSSISSPSRARRLQCARRDIGGIISEEDIEHAASFLEPTHRPPDIWRRLGRPFAVAVRDAGGRLEGPHPYELVEAAEAA